MVSVLTCESWCSCISLAAINAAVTAFKANVAQLVEQLIRNEQVVGSIPTVGSMF